MASHPPYRELESHPPTADQHTTGTQTPDEKLNSFIVPSETAILPSTTPTPYAYASPQSQARARQRSRWTRRTKLIASIVVIGTIVVFLAVFLPVFLVLRGRGSKSNAPVGPAGQGSGQPNPASPSGATSGGDGSTVILSNGTTFIYSNPFGGFWVEDPNDPYTSLAQPNSWTPPLNTSWTWGTDRVYGVNLGGWLVLEPFITPDIFQRYPTAVDEFTLSQLMAADQANGGLDQIESHYDTFITEQDIAEIAGAGLNFLRVPLPFWAIETWPGEPYLSKVAWKYFLRMLGWARKYGLRVCLDLHAVPGSQNGFNHSGKLAPVGFMAGNMGLANAQRTLYYLRVLTEFISQPEYKNLIPIFGIVNEALVGVIGIDQMTSFYLQAHGLIRNITGSGEGNGPYISIHDGFQPLSIWNGFLAGSDRIMLDEHPYFSFGGPQPDPLGVLGPNGQPGGPWPQRACDNWGPSTNQSRTNFGVVFAGEFSASPNDCGLFLTGVNSTASTPDCGPYNDWQSYNDTMKAGIQNFVEASFDALGDWFFWTWKIAPSAASGQIETPLWSYQLGVREGWIPTDPRVAFGMCAALGTLPSPFNDTYEPWQTGAQTSTIAPSSSSMFAFPPQSFAGAVVPLSLMPTYTSTGTILTLPVETFTGAPASVTSAVDGWANPSDTVGGVTTVSGCVYPFEYDGIFSVTPTVPCTGPTAGVVGPTITPVPAPVPAPVAVTVAGVVGPTITPAPVPAPAPVPPA
ncbi:glycoside hydrolase superfamily [Cyathus striatus]|nr:glycoside hydrolase superfamily [Cyathus striatus]